MQELRECSGAISSLLPMATHASLAFSFTQAIGRSKVFCALSWEHFLEMFVSVLSDITERDSDRFGEHFWKDAAPAEWTLAQREVILKLNHKFVQEAFK